MYRSARLEFLTAAGTPHRTTNHTRKSLIIQENKINKPTCRRANSHSLSGIWVGTYAGRHRGGGGRHWPSGPQVICRAPSSWKPWLQVKFRLAPARTFSPEGMRELATAGVEQVVSPAGGDKTDRRFSNHP